MPTPFKDLEFSFKQVRILRKLRDDGCISKELVRSNLEYSFLQKYNLIDNDPERYDIYRPSDIYAIEEKISLGLGILTLYPVSLLLLL